MKVIAAGANLLVVGLIAVTLLPEMQLYIFELTIAALVVALIAFIVGILHRDDDKHTPHFSSNTEILHAHKKQDDRAGNRSETDILCFLGSLQEKGRFVDFLMDDVSSYSDAQVGAAARIVHSGCKQVLQQCFKIEPLFEEKEGTTITVQPGYSAHEVRLTGKISGSAPFTGTLVHRGWKTSTVRLPQITRDNLEKLPSISPAEVNLR